MDQAKQTSIAGKRVVSPNAFVTNCDVGLDASYLLTPLTTMMLSYTDQTLLGPAANSILNRMLGVSVQYRWER
jgi:outer membrane scaffolding protein for murein synthesis (MipA/OmpV family)